MTRRTEGEGHRPAATADADVADSDVVRRIADGDEDALRLLFRRYAAHANALALRVLRQPFLAEEAVQDAFVAAWRSAPSFDPSRGSVRGWLIGLVHNRAVDLVRREESQRRRADARAAEPRDVEDAADDAIRLVDAAAEVRVVRSALDELPREQRQVVELMYFDGLSQSAIAERLSLPLGTVKSRALLAMRRLRGRLAGLER